MNASAQIAVLGAGAWGTALASIWAANGLDVTLWARRNEIAKEISLKHCNERYLPGIPLDERLAATSEIGAMSEAGIVVCVTPAQSLRTLLHDLENCLDDAAQLILCAKGIDRQSGKLMAEVANECLPDHHCAVLSGPSFADDVARGLPTAVTLAAPRLRDAAALAATLSTPSFRIYASDDVTGVEAGGALKNVAALAVGMARGMELGASAEAALIARAFAEMQRLAVALGGRAETLAGLSGLGDLVLTCSSPQSRNFAYGMAAARGENLDNRPLAEGVFSAQMASSLARGKGVETPIFDAVSAILAGTLPARKAVTDLLSRPLKPETG